MALSIDPCHDVEKFEESVIAGLNAKKTVYLAIALACGGTVALILILVAKLPMLLGVYGAAPVSFVIMILGLYEKDGMNMFQLMKNRKSKNQNKPISYSSTESKTNYEKHGKVEVVQDKATADAEFEKLKKLLIGAAIGIVLLVVLIVVIVVVVLS